MSKERRQRTLDVMELLYLDHYVEEKKDGSVFDHYVLDMIGEMREWVEEQDD